jgi:A/G-specific adenine glycosylase
MQIRSLREPLLRWFRRHGRQLPWRGREDAYAVWVSEIMLQQTQVATVIPYYERFMERFPDVRSLAGASEDEVLSLWSGLGYYRRARALLAAANEVVERHGGRIPDDPESLRALPGIGRYTAGAIASIAYDRPEPVLDGNVRRVLSRILARDGGTGGRGALDRELWGVARTLASGPHPGDLNQALMELGALVCTPRAPACDVCPVSASCRARTLGSVERYPPSEDRTPSIRVRVAVAVIGRASRVLLERPHADGPFRGRWDLPAVELGSSENGRETLRDGIAARHGLEIRPAESVAVARHGIMHRRLRLDVHPCTLRRGRVASNRNLRWVDPDSLSGVPVSGATHKVLDLVQRGRSSSMRPASE